MVETIIMEEALKLFYDKGATCPGGDKGEILRETSIEGGDGIFRMRCKKGDWEMTIRLPKIINVYLALDETKRERLVALFGMIEAVNEDRRDLFEENKGVFEPLNERVKGLTALLSSQDGEREEALLRQGEAYDKLQEIYYRRQELYAPLDKDLTNGEILEMVKTGKGDKGWLGWIEVGKEYVKANREYLKVKGETDALIAKQDRDLVHYVAQEGSVSTSGTPKGRKGVKGERKTIKIKRKKKAT